MKEAAKSGNPIVQLAFTGHGSDLAIVLQDELTLQVLGKQVFIMNTDTNYRNDITPLLLAGLEDGATIDLRGCETAKGVNNIAKDISIALGSKSIKVIGSSLPQIRCERDHAIALPYSTKVYVNGNEIR